jgi:hypothetical protein
MAGDWIKLRTDVHTDPAVIRISRATGLDVYGVVGRLTALWSWADKHTEDGNVTGVNAEWVDSFVRADGIADAMIAVGWLAISADGIEFPRFDRYMGASAKVRTAATERQRESRARRDSSTTRTSLPAATRRAVMARDASTCVYCGQVGNVKRAPSGFHNVITPDHVTPLSQGGTDEVSNLAACCAECNNSKNGRTPEQWGVLPTYLQPGLAYAAGCINPESVTRHTPVTTKCDKTVTREEKRREEEKPSPPAAAGEEKRPRKGKSNPLFDAVAEVTGSAPKAAGSHIALVVKALAAEDPPFTPDEVREFGRRFHELCSWAAKDGRSRPELGELQKHIGKVRAPPVARSPDRGFTPPPDFGTQPPRPENP